MTERHRIAMHAACHALAEGDLASEALLWEYASTMRETIRAAQVSRN